MDDKQRKTSQARVAQAAVDADADSAMRRQQDLAAEVLQLQEALRDVRLRVEESQARCEALELGRREALAEAEDARARTRALQQQFEALQRQFESRIAELRGALDSLRPRENNPPHPSTGAG